jgi:hypothetical protein
MESLRKLSARGPFSAVSSRGGYKRLLCDRYLFKAVGNYFIAATANAANDARKREDIGPTVLQDLSSSDNHLASHSCSLHQSRRSQALGKAEP